MRKFQTLATEAFAFLETDFGFKRHPINEGRLDYEAQDVFVAITYDGQRSNELSLDIGNRVPNICQSFNFGEVLRTAKAPSNVAACYQVSSEEALKRFLSALADALRAHGVDFLKNDAVAFEKLAQLRDLECRQYAIERDLRIARAEVEIAWHKKDYAAVVRIFKPLRANLTAVENAKTEYAERKIREIGGKN